MSKKFLDASGVSHFYEKILELLETAVGVIEDEIPVAGTDYLTPSAISGTYATQSSVSELSDTVDELEENKRTFITREATFNTATAEFISTTCTWADVLDAIENNYEINIIGNMGDNTLWFRPEAISLATGYRKAQFKGFSTISGYNIVATLTIPETGTASCTFTYNEKISDKVSTWSSTTTDTHYPSEKLVKTALDSKALASDLTTETNTRSSQIQAVEERLDRLEGSIQYYLLELYEDTYIDPSTLQPVSGRIYEDDDFATDELGDINLKAWLKYNYELHDYEDLNTASVNITGFEIGYDKLWEYWTNLTNSQISTYTSLQQTGQYRNEGTGASADFTNTVHGNIVGYASPGYVETAGSGKGKVNGWDALYNQVQNIASAGNSPATSLPLIDVQGGAIGTSSDYARGDHQHPTDTSREAAAYKVSAWSATPNDNNYPTEKLVKDSLDSEASSRAAADTALGNRTTALETFKDTTVPNTYALKSDLQTAQTNIGTLTTNLTSVTNRVSQNESDIADLQDALEDLNDPTNPNSVSSQVASILDSAPEDLNTFLEVLERFEENEGDITDMQADISEAVTVKSYNSGNANPTTYIIKVQSGTSGLSSDANTLTFCY